MKVEFTENKAAPWGQFTITPDDDGETRLLNMMFGTASLMRVPMAITGFNQDEAGNVARFSVGFVIPQAGQKVQEQTAQPGQLTGAAKDAIAAQDVVEGKGNLEPHELQAMAQAASDIPLQSPPEPT